MIFSRHRNDVRAVGAHDLKRMIMMCKVTLESYLLRETILADMALEVWHIILHRTPGARS
jgi:hypothetical protein